MIIQFPRPTDDEDLNESGLYLPGAAVHHIELIDDVSRDFVFLGRGAREIVSKGVAQEILNADEAHLDVSIPRMGLDLADAHRS